MQDCESYEIAIGMRTHGALARREDEALEAHLQGCVACRAFQDLAKGTDRIMIEQAATAMHSLDWDALLARTKAHLERRSRDVTVAVVVTCATTVPICSLIYGHVLAVALGAVGSGAIVLAVRRWSSSRMIARASGEASTGELLFFYRRELENRLDRTRKLPLIFAVWLPLEFYLMRAHLVSLQAWLGFGAMGCVVAAIMGYFALVRRPQLERELTALKADAARE